MTRVFVPGDAMALALGAEGVAEALTRAASAQRLDIEIVRTGSRGMGWLEPLIEVDASSGRVGYGPVTASDVPAVFPGRKRPKPSEAIA